MEPLCHFHSVVRSQVQLRTELVPVPTTTKGVHLTSPRPGWPWLDLNTNQGTLGKGFGLQTPRASFLNSSRFGVWLGSTEGRRFSGSAAFGQVKSRKPLLVDGERQVSQQ